MRSSTTTSSIRPCACSLSKHPSTAYRPSCSIRTASPSQSSGHETSSSQVSETVAGTRHSTWTVALSTSSSALSAKAVKRVMVVSLDGLDMR